MKRSTRSLRANGGYARAASRRTASLETTIRRAGSAKRTKASSRLSRSVRENVPRNRRCWRSGIQCSCAAAVRGGTFQFGKTTSASPGSAAAESAAPGELLGFVARRDPDQLRTVGGRELRNREREVVEVVAAAQPASRSKVECDLHVVSRAQRA